MKAEDTIVTNKEIIDYHKKLFPWMYQGNDDEWCEEQLDRFITLTESNDVKTLLNNQAEISFKSGIKEVVDWIEPLFHFYDCPESECPIYHKWQSKLKEWGVE